MPTVDSFEDGNISEYGGNTGSFSAIGAASATDGSYYLEMSGSPYQGIASTSGLNYYPQPGDRITWDSKFHGGTQNHMFFFAAQSESGNPNGYEVRMSPFNSNLALRVDGNAVASTSASWSQGTWYSGRVDWGSNGDMFVEVEERSTGNTIASVSTTDTTYTGGGVGFRNGEFQAHSRAYWDNVQAEPLLTAPDAPSNLNATLS